MFKKVLISIGLIVAAALAYVAMQPSEFRFAREIRIHAPAEAIFPYLNNPRTMNVWNPWMKLDPQVKLTYSGPDEGVGAVSSWEGDRNVGAGSATVVESLPHQLVRVKLDNHKPFEATSTVEYTVTTVDGQSVVNWAISGRRPFIPKIFCTLFMNMDKMMGETFDKGLADLKAIVETSVAAK